MEKQETPSESTLSTAIEDNQWIYDDYFDPAYSIAVAKEIAGFLSTYYFRTKTIGFQPLPQRNNPEHPLIYISNHSGMAFPWDGMIMCARFLDESQQKWQDAIRPLVAPILSKSQLMNPFLVKDLWKKVGALDASFLNFETMMHYQGSNVMIYPEGIAGIGKGYNYKYQLQRFSSSFIYNSIKYKTDVMSILTVNGEHINPYSYISKWVNKFVQLFGIPFFPLGMMTPWLFLQPWVFYFAFPAKLTFVMGKRYQPYKMTDKPIEELSREELRKMAETIRSDMQIDLDQAVSEYGQDPYSWKEHWGILKANWKLFPYTVPQGWPLMMTEFERAYKVHQKTGEPIHMDLGSWSTLKILLKNPFLISFFIPILGWIPIFIKGFRK